MARNRKYRSAVVRFGPALKACVLCLLIGGSGVGYVWQKEQIVRLGKQTKIREKCLQELEGKNTKLRRQLAGLYSPKSLEDRIKKLNLGLVLPQASQIIYLTEPGIEGATPNLNLPLNPVGQYASQSQNPLIMP